MCWLWGLIECGEHVLIGFPSYTVVVSRRRNTMKGHWQWTAEIHIDAPASRVWEIGDDISLIPQYHPEVAHVDFISGNTKRALGVKYRCHILEGRRGTCVEEIVDYVPNQRMTVAFPEDSWGMTKMFAHFTVDTTVIPESAAQRTSTRSLLRSNRRHDDSAERPAYPSNDEEEGAGDNEGHKTAC